MSREKSINICDRVIEGCFYVLLAAVTFSISLVEIAASVMIGAWFVRKALDRDIRSLDSLPVRILFLYLAWVLLSCFNSSYASESFRGVFKALEYSLLFIVVGTTRWKKTAVDRSLYVMLSVAVIICANGIIQFLTGEGLIRHRALIAQDYMRRISSSFVHPNDFGVYLTVVTLVFLSAALSRWRGLREKAVLLAGALFTMLSLFLTRSRGAWLSFAAGATVFGAARGKKFIFIVLAVLVAAVILMPSGTRERLTDLADLKSGTSWERIMLWKGSLEMIKVHPVLGFGVNTYSRNFPKYKPEDYPDVRYAHNCYIHMASEIGVPGALIYVSFLLSVILLSLKRARTMKEGRERDLVAGLCAGIAGFALNCAVDTHLYSLNPAVFFHILMGFCFALTAGRENA